MKVLVFSSHTLSYTQPTLETAALGCGKCWASTEEEHLWGKFSTECQRSSTSLWPWKAGTWYCRAFHTLVLNSPHHPGWGARLSYSPYIEGEPDVCRGNYLAPGGTGTDRQGRNGTLAGPLRQLTVQPLSLRRRPRPRPPPRSGHRPTHVRARPGAAGAPTTGRPGRAGRPERTLPARHVRPAAPGPQAPHRPAAGLRAGDARWVAGGSVGCGRLGPPAFVPRFSRGRGVWGRLLFIRVLTLGGTFAWGCRVAVGQMERRGAQIELPRRSQNGGSVRRGGLASGNGSGHSSGASLGPGPRAWLAARKWIFCE